jgi:hypothetical protein
VSIAAPRSRLRSQAAELLISARWIIRLRIRLDLLSGKLRDLVTAGAATPNEEQERLDAFVREFRRKWRARTACRPPWVSESDCGIQPTRSR